MTDVVAVLLACAAWLCLGQAAMLWKAGSIQEFREEIEKDVPTDRRSVAFAWGLCVLLWPFVLLARRLKEKGEEE